MPRPYPVEVRDEAVARVMAGESIAEVARCLNLAKTTLYSWIYQSRIYRR